MTPRKNKRTVMVDGDGLAGREHGEGAELNCGAGDVFELDAGERGRRAGSGGNRERVGRKLVQRPAGIIQDLEGFVTGVGQGGSELEVFHRADGGGSWYII